MTVATVEPPEGEEVEESEQTLPGLPPNMRWNMVVDGTGSARFERDYFTIHELIGKILSELPSIPKDREVSTSGPKFKYRGIDDVLNELNPLLSKYGVYFRPDAVARVDQTRQSGSGNAQYVVHLHVRYTFTGPAGDSFECSSWGEGVDSGDKGTAKAMTGAMKYMLFQVFAIAVDEQSEADADLVQPPDSSPGPPARIATPQMLLSIKERLLSVLTVRGEYPDEWKAAKCPKVETIDSMLAGDRPMASEAHVNGWSAALEPAEQALEVEEHADEPCAVCKSARSIRQMVNGVWRCARRSECDKRAEQLAPADSDEPAPAPVVSDPALMSDEGRADHAEEPEPDETDEA